MIVKCNVKKLYKKLAGKALVNYCKTSGLKLTVSNYLNQIRGSNPYIEIYYDNDDGTED